MARNDDLDTLIDELAADDPDVHLRVAAALQRRELARELADCRRAAGLTQVAIAERMGTSQGQVTRFESGADTRLSTVARYAAALGVQIGWIITPARRTRRFADARATPRKQPGSLRTLGEQPRPTAST